MNFKNKRTFVKCLSALISSVCVFQQPSVFAETIYIKGIDGIYTIKDEKSFYKLITNLPYDIKWKMVIDGNQHDKGTKVYDEDRLQIDDNDFGKLIEGFVEYLSPYYNQKTTPGHICGDYMETFGARGLFHGKTVYGEKGYLEGMLNLWDFLTQKLSNSDWQKLDSNKLKELHDIGINKVSDKLTGFNNGWFPIGSGNSNYKGLLESFAAKKAGFKFEQKVSEMLLKNNIPEHEDNQGWKIEEHSPYSIEYVGKWDEPFDWEKDKNIYSLSGGLPTLDIIKHKQNYMNEVLQQLERQRLRLKLTFGNTGLGKNYVDEAFDEFYKTLREIKSNPRFELPKFNLSDGYNNYTSFLREKFCEGNTYYKDEKTGMFEFLEEEYNRIKKPYVSESQNEKVIELIVRFCRALDQAHVFPDGNIRTYRMLMNMLLMQNGMLPGIFFNWNTLDCHSVGYLVNEVKQGQKKFVDLLISNKNMIKNEVGIEI